MRTKSKLTALLLIPVLLTFTLFQVGCGNTQKLERVGSVAVQLAKGLSDQITALEASGLPPGKLAGLKRASAAFTASANTLNSMLTGLKDVDGQSAAAITSEIAKATAVISGLLQNPDVLGLGESSTFIQVLKYSTVALYQLSLTLTAFFPPAPPGQIGISNAGTKTVKASAITVEFPEPPPQVKAILQK